MVTIGTSTPQYTPSGDAMLCYDCNWHPGCQVQLNYPYLFCTDCRVIAHVDLVGVHITVESCCKERASG